MSGHIAALDRMPAPGVPIGDFPRYRERGKCDSTRLTTTAHSAERGGQLFLALAFCYQSLLQVRGSV
jgi:hypothetical protein